MFGQDGRVEGKRCGNKLSEFFSFLVTELSKEFWQRNSSSSYYGINTIWNDPVFKSSNAPGLLGSGEGGGGGG